MVYNLKIDKNKDLDKIDSNLLSTKVVKEIIKNLKNNFHSINVLKITVNEHQLIYNIRIKREDFLDVLKRNLIFKEKREDYLMCIEIREAIKFLQTKK
jgi:hypothetical protein